MANDAPCWGCRERFEACHGSCVLYKTWQAQFRNEQQRKMDRYDTDDLLREGISKRMKLIHKK